MKYLKLLVLVLLASCNYQPEYIYETVDQTVTVVDKKEAIETDFVYTENFLGSGDSMMKKVPQTQTVYYIIFNEGTVERVTIQEYYKYKIGSSYIIKKQVKKINPKYQR